MQPLSNLMTPQPSGTALRGRTTGRASLPQAKPQRSIKWRAQTPAAQRPRVPFGVCSAQQATGSHPPRSCASGTVSPAAPSPVYGSSPVRALPAVPAPQRCRRCRSQPGSDEAAGMYRAGPEQTPRTQPCPPQHKAQQRSERQTPTRRCVPRLPPCSPGSPADRPPSPRPLRPQAPREQLPARRGDPEPAGRECGITALCRTMANGRGTGLHPSGGTVPAPGAAAPVRTGNRRF